MRIIKYLLAIPLLFVLILLGVVFVGPVFLKNALEQSVPAKLEIHGLKISPMLTISADEIDFLTHMKPAKKLEGKARGVVLDWSVKDFFEIKISAISIESQGIGVADSLDLSLSPVSLFDWSEISYTGKLGTVEFKQPTMMVAATSVNATGKVDFISSTLNSPIIVFSDIQANAGGQSYKAPILRVGADKYELSKGPNKQSLTFQVNAHDGAVLEAASLGEISINGSLEQSSVAFKAQARSAVSETLGLDVGPVGLDATFDLSSYTFEPSARFSAAFMSLYEPKTAISSVEAELALRDLSEISYTGHTEAIKLEQSDMMVTASEAYASGKVDFIFSKISSPVFVLNDVQAQAGRQSFSAPTLRVGVDKYELSKDPTQQSLTFQVNGEDGAILTGVPLSKIKIDGSLEQTRAAFKAQAYGVLAENQGLNIGSLVVEAGYDLVSQSFEPKAQVKSSNMALSKPKITITSADAEVSRSVAGSLVVSISADLERATLGTKDLYIGEVGAGTLNVLGEMQLIKNTSNSNVILRLNYGDEKNMGIFSETYFTVQASDLSKCLRHVCNMSNITASYVFDVGGERLQGFSKCDAQKCDALKFSHKFTTSDTNAFFSNLSGLKSFNPLLIQILNVQLRSGRPVGAGHVVEF